jgi:hypothetical protein
MGWHTSGWAGEEWSLSEMGRSCGVTVTHNLGWLVGLGMKIGGQRSHILKQEDGNWDKRGDRIYSKPSISEVEKHRRDTVTC